MDRKKFLEFFIKKNSYIKNLILSFSIRKVILLAEKHSDYKSTELQKVLEDISDILEKESRLDPWQSIHVLATSLMHRLELLVTLPILEKNQNLEDICEKDFFNFYGDNKSLEKEKSV